MRWSSVLKTMKAVHWEGTKTLCLQSTRTKHPCIEKNTHKTMLHFFKNKLQYKQPKVYPNGSWASSKPWRHISIIRLARYLPRAFMQLCRTKHPWQCTAMLRQLAAAPSNMNCLNRVNINICAENSSKVRSTHTKQNYVCRYSSKVRSMHT